MRQVPRRFFSVEEYRLGKAVSLVNDVVATCMDLFLSFQPGLLIIEFVCLFVLKLGFYYVAQINLKLEITQVF